MDTLKFLTLLVEHHQILAYLVIFFGLIFEGEVIVITTGVLAHLGGLSFPVSLVFIIAGGLCKTFLGYYLGTFLQKKYNHNKVFLYIENRVLAVMPRFKKKPFWSIFLSKFIMGVNYMVVIFSGYENIDKKTYLKAELLSTAIWAPLLLSIGYFFSYAAGHISRDIGIFSLSITIFIIAFLLLDKLAAILYQVFEHLENGNKQ